MLPEDNSIKVLLTGFEPFGDPLPNSNPSWEAIKSLNGEILSSEGNRFSITCVRIPVEYNPVERILPELHNIDSFKFVIHVGQCHKSEIYIESQASSFGYCRKDNLGISPKNSLAPFKYIPKDKDPNNYVTYTAIKTRSLCEYLVVKKNYNWISHSIDAGRYLCEYTFFCSLGEAEAINKQNSDAKRNVLFVHVPNPNSDFSLEKITDSIKEVIYALPNYS